MNINTETGNCNVQKQSNKFNNPISVKEVVGVHYLLWNTFKWHSFGFFQFLILKKLHFLIINKILSLSLSLSLSLCKLQPPPPWTSPHHHPHHQCRCQNFDTNLVPCLSKKDLVRHDNVCTCVIYLFRLFHI